jgi:hypothetical protein
MDVIDVIDVKKVEEEYKKKEFLATLQKGNTVIRRGLLIRLLNLSGHVDKCPWSTTNKIKNDKFDSVIIINKHYHSYYHLCNTLPILIDNTFLKVLDLFIGDCILNTNGINYKLFFNKKNVSWGVLDEALKHAYPNHYTPDKNGFIFLNVKRRKDINKIHETPHNFFNPYK